MAYIPVEDRLKIGEMVKYYRTQQDYKFSTHYGI